MRERQGELALVARYGLVGVLNSVIGWTLILGLDLSGALPPAPANAAGFGGGVAVGFVLHGQIFGASRTPAETTRYLSAVALAFAANQVVLQLAQFLLGPAPLERAASQACAILVYSGTLFLLCRLWVFARPPQAAAAS